MNIHYSNEETRIAERRRSQEWPPSFLSGRPPAIDTLKDRLISLASKADDWARTTERKGTRKMVRNMKQRAKRKGEGGRV